MKLENERRNKSSSYAAPLSDLKYGASLYESPFRNYTPFRGFSTGVEDLSDILKSPLGDESNKSRDIVEAPKSETKIVVSSPSELGFKNKAKEEKYSSNAVGAALMWGQPEETQNRERSPENQTSHTETKKTYEINLNSNDNELSQKIEELKYNIEEEKRLKALIRDPPVQYRKAKKQQQLKEDLKKAQRKIYELNFYIKSNSNN